MKQEIFSILSTALERAYQDNKAPRKPRFSSVYEQKVLENLRQSSEYRNYVKDNLIDDGALLMNTNADIIYQQIESLNSLPTKELRKLWFEQIGTESSPYMQKRALIERLAYVMQERAFGGMSSEAQKRLDVFADRLKKGQPLLCEKVQLAPGTILSREYNGKKHVIKILEDEKVEYKGEVHNSLSAVARAITGTRWNGRIFFMLKKAEINGGFYERSLRNLCSPVKQR
jgi:hypothetical protein